MNSQPQRGSGSDVWSLSIWLVAVALADFSALRGQEASLDERGFSVPSPIARRMSAGYRELDDRRRQLETELAALAPPPQNEQGARIGWKVFGFGDALPVRQWVEIDLGASHRIDAVALIPADAAAANSSEPGIGFPRRFRVELEGAGGSLTVIADYTATDFPHPGALPVCLPARGTLARRVRVMMNRPWGKKSLYAYAFGEIMVLSGNRNLATGLPGVTVRSSGSLESPPTWSRENLIDGQSLVGAPLRKSSRPLAHGWESARYPTSSATAWVQIDLRTAQPFDEVRLLPARLAHYSTRHGYGLPGKLRVEVGEDASFHHARVLADWTAQPLGNPAFNPITVPGDARPARYVRVTAEELWPRNQDTFVFALAELQIYRGDQNLAYEAPVMTDRAVPAIVSYFNPSFLTDGLRGSQKLIEWPEWLGELSRRREILYEIDGIRLKMAAIHPALARATAWSLSAVLVLLALGTLAVFFRTRHAQARAVVALQRRIAGDLHDEVGSNLASIAMLSELGQRQAAGITAPDVEEIRRLASESAAAMRDLVWLIQPGPHDAPHLADRLRAATRRQLGAQAWHFEITGLNAAPSLDVQRHLLLGLKEMLHNVLRHAGAQHVAILLAVTGEHFTLEVRDDGHGFDVSDLHAGHGFTSLRHRAELLGGNLTLESQPGHGTRVALHGSLRPAARVSLPPR